MIEINETTYVDTIWFVSGDDLDLLAFLYRQDDGPWMITYRFRYYEDDKAHDSEDRKSWFAVKASGSTEKLRLEALTAMRRVASLTRVKTGGQLQELSVKGGAAECHAVMKDQPWVHREESP